MTTRTKMRRLFVLVGVLVGSMLAGIVVGATWVDPLDVLRALVGSDDDTDRTARIIVRDLRLPRVLLAAAVGAGLAVAGSAYQGVFRNPLAEPFVVGAASGAALGVTLAIVKGWTFLPIPLAAFVGAIGAVAVTFACNAAVRTESTAGLLLTGVAVGTLLNAAVWVLLSWNDRELARIVGWLMGSLADRGWTDLGRVLPWLAAGALGVWLLARPLDALAEGEETARGLGLPVRLAVALSIAAASLAAAAAVSAAGIVGFVGLIAPHIARRLVGESHAWLVPASGLVGGALMVLADTTARTLTAPTELPVGVVTAALGGPFFLYLISRART